MRGEDHEPYMQCGNVRLCHDEYRLLERDGLLFGETTAASTRNQREYGAGHIAWAEGMAADD